MGKVIFSQVFVCSQWEICIPAMPWEGRTPPPLKADLPSLRRQYPHQKADPPPCQDTDSSTGYGQQVESIHPTGMHTCWRQKVFKYLAKSNLRKLEQKFAAEKLSLYETSRLNGNFHCLNLPDPGSNNSYGSAPSHCTMLLLSTIVTCIWYHVMFHFAVNA